MLHQSLFQPFTKNHSNSPKRKHQKLAIHRKNTALGTVSNKNKSERVFFQISFGTCPKTRSYRKARKLKFRTFFNLDAFWAPREPNGASMWLPRAVLLWLFADSGTVLAVCLQRRQSKKKPKYSKRSETKHIGADPSLVAGLGEALCIFRNHESSDWGHQSSFWGA